MFSWQNTITPHAEDVPTTGGAIIVGDLMQNTKWETHFANKTIQEDQSWIRSFSLASLL